MAPIFGVRMYQVRRAHRSAAVRPPWVNFWWKISLSAQKVITRARLSFPSRKAAQRRRKTHFPQAFVDAAAARVHFPLSAPLYDSFPSRPSGRAAAYCVLLPTPLARWKQSCGGGLKSWRNMRRSAKLVLKKIKAQALCSFLKIFAVNRRTFLRKLPKIFFLENP